MVGQLTSSTTLVVGMPGKDDDRDRAEERDAGAIEFQSRHMPERDAEIGQRENHQHRGRG